MPLTMRGCCAAADAPIAMTIAQTTVARVRRHGGHCFAMPGSAEALPSTDGTLEAPRVIGTLTIARRAVRVRG